MEFLISFPHETPIENRCFSTWKFSGVYGDSTGIYTALNGRNEACRLWILYAKIKMWLFDHALRLSVKLQHNNELLSMTVALNNMK
jgi:hypothetical protein